MRGRVLFDFVVGLSVTDWLFSVIIRASDLPAPGIVAAQLSPQQQARPRYGAPSVTAECQRCARFGKVLAH